MTWVLFALAGMLEVSLVGVLLTAYRVNYKPDWTSFVMSVSGAMCAVFMLSTVASALLVLRVWRKAKWECGPLSTHGIYWNLAVVVIVVAVGEVGLRLAAVPTVGGEHIGKMPLLPRGWDRIARDYTAMVTSFEVAPDYFEHDPMLGWRVGASRASRNGLFFSSIEGVRSSVKGMSYAQLEGRCRIALVGDSFTFGEEAKFENTWGYYLQQSLGGSCHILNFAVPGYSIAQMYLKFRRDIVPWQPQIVIMGFTDGASERTLGVYCFLMMAAWKECPWVAPRFVMQQGTLQLINVPLPDPRTVYAKQAISDLEHIRYDRWFRSFEWEQPGWSWFYASYWFRLLTSLAPGYDGNRDAVSDHAREEVNGALFKAFIDLAVSNGMHPLLVYLPMKEDFNGRNPQPFTHQILESSHIPFADLTQCVKEIDSAVRFIEGGDHYRPVGEAHVARCIAAELEERGAVRQL